jgi:hypothetical protein
MTAYRGAADGSSDGASGVAPGCWPQQCRPLHRQRGSPSACALPSPGTAATRHRVIATVALTAAAAGRSNRPMPPPASAASCSRRAAVMSSVSISSRAPATPGQRRLSSMAQSASARRGACTKTRSAGARPKRMRPGGQASGSGAIQNTVPPVRASSRAQKPAAAPGSSARTSCRAARARPPPGRAASIAGLSGKPA